MSSFEDELNELKIRLPGSCEISFSHDDELSRFLKSQNPSWKERGSVSSIPIARVPRLFLQNSEITLNLEERYKAIQTGEVGEKTIFEKLMKLKDLNLDGGTLIFPNVDGNHFCSQEAKVEIDFIVVDTRKGVFVVSVKNARQIMESTLVESMQKHVNFVRLLRDFNKCIGAMTIPVHGVVCSLKRQVSILKLKQKGYWSDTEPCEQRFVFQPVENDNFGASWNIMLDTVPNVQESESEELHKLVCRLAILNSMEGTLACLHKRFESNTIQQMKFNKREAAHVLKKTLSESVNCQENECAEIASDLLKIKMEQKASRGKDSRKQSLILWTNEQLNVIRRIHAALKKHNSSRDGLRLLVAGPKGSGKTLLLCYVAELAKLVLASKIKGRDSKIVLCDGRFGGTLILFERLVESFKNRGISVVPRCLQLESELKSYDVVLIDEYVHRFDREHVSNLAHKQHCIMFTSDKTAISETNCLPEFEKLQLFSTLRSTVELAIFVENFRKQGNKDVLLPLQVKHNFHGQEPIVKVHHTAVEDDPEQKLFAKEASETILQVLQESRGLETILVTPFVHPITLSKIMSKLSEENIQFEYRNPHDYMSKSSSREKICKGLQFHGILKTSGVAGESPTSATRYPVVVFGTGNYVDGVEFGSVVVLIEKSLPHFWHCFMYGSLFTAFSRATTKLVAVVNDIIEAPILEKQTLHDSVPEFWSSLSSKNVTRKAYTWVKAKSSDFGREVLSVVEKLPCSEHPILIVGRCPNTVDIVEVDAPVTGKLMSIQNKKIFRWFKLPNENLLAVIENLKDIIGYFGNLLNQDFSSLLLAMDSEIEYVNVLNTMEQHTLLYFMLEKQLEKSPIVLLTYSSFNIAYQESEFHLLCNFLTQQAEKSVSSRNQESKKGSQLILEKTTEEPRLQTEKQMVHKQSLCEVQESRGVIEFIECTPSQEAICNLNNSLELLYRDYENRLNSSKVEDLCKLREKIAEIAFKVADTYFCVYLDNKYQEEAYFNFNCFIHYFTKSLNFNPRLLESNERVKKYLEQTKELNLFRKIENRNQEVKKILDDGNVQNAIATKVLDDKIRGSPCYDLIKFKSNCILLDKKEKLCHQSVLGAINATYLAGHEKVSLLMNPGVYEEPRTILLGSEDPLAMPCEVDIVGNWVPVADNDSLSKWIAKDSPIVIQNVVRGTKDPISHIFWQHTFQLDLGSLSLTRVTVRNWQPLERCVVFSGYASEFRATQCSFKSKCGAAISLHDHSKVFIEKCRFVDTYGAVFVSSERTSVNSLRPYRGEGHLAMSDCLVDQTNVVGIELREDITASIENCSIQNCSFQAISAILGAKVTVVKCHLKRNAFRNTPNEGAIQLSHTKSKLLNTVIINQSGNGVVTEWGEAILDNVSISNCNLAGVLVGGECTVLNSSIQNCAMGMCISPDGLLKMKGNQVSRCRNKVFRMPRSRAPIEEDVEVDPGLSRVLDGISNLLVDRENAIAFLEQRKKVAEELEKETTVLDFVSGSRKHCVLNCAYCTSNIYSVRSSCILCQRCEVRVFCSKACFEKGAETHKKFCDVIIDVISRYEKLTNNEAGNSKTFQSEQEKPKKKGATKSRKNFSRNRKR